VSATSSCLRWLRAADSQRINCIESLSVLREHVK